MAVVVEKLASKEELWEARKARYRKYWYYYLGYQWGDPTVRGDIELTFNYCRAVVDILVRFVFGKGINFSVIGDISEEEKDKIFKIVNNVLERNNFYAKLIELATICSVCGDVFIRVWFEDGKIKLTVFDPTYIFPYWDSAYNLTKVIVQFSLYEEKEDGSTEEIPYEEIWTRDFVKIRRGEEVNAYDNPYGEVPFVHIKNYPLPNSFWGVSDIEPIMDLNVEVNKNLTGFAQMLDYHRSPILIVRGAKAEGLVVGPNQIWQLPKDADVEYLTVPVPDRVLDFASLLVQAIHDFSGVPEFAFSSRGIPTNTSATSLQLQFAPLFRNRDLKILTYTEGFKRLLKLITVLSDMKYKLLDFDFKIEFPYPLPVDEGEELSILNQKINLGLTSRIKTLIEKGVARNEKEAKEFLVNLALETRLFNPYMPVQDVLGISQVLGIKKETEEVELPDITWLKQKINRFALFRVVEQQSKGEQNA
jgi:hypothetical protein